MAVYELAIEKKQPTCGGKSPTNCEILSVTTDDPMAYVRKAEAGAEIELVSEEDGVILIRAERNGLWVNYEFTED